MASAFSHLGGPDRGASPSESVADVRRPGAPRLRDPHAGAERVALVGEVLDVIRELKDEGMTIVMATHEMGFAQEVADRVCFLHEGRVLEQGPPAALFGAPEMEQTRAFLARI